MGLRQNLDILPDFSDNSAFNKPKIMKIGQKLSVLLAKRYFLISSFFFHYFFHYFFVADLVGVFFRYGVPDALAPPPRPVAATGHQ